MKAAQDEVQTKGSAGGGMRLLRRKWPLLVLGCAPLLFFWRSLLLGMTLYAGDTAFVFLPLRHYVRDRLLRGELPLWNPHLFGGTPALAEPQYQLFYLPNLLLLPAGVSTGMAAMLPLHSAWMAAGTYLFGRRSLRLGRAAAVFAALVFTFSGSVLSRAANSPYLEAAAWLPWLLLAYDAARERGGSALMFPGLALAAQLLTGAPQVAFYSLVLLFAYHLYQCWGKRGSAGASARAWTALVSSVAVGVFLAAGQLIPQAELALHSDRVVHGSYAYATAFSLAPRHLLATLIFPKFFGTFNCASIDGFYPGEELAYLGVLPLGLIAAALAARRPRRGPLFWATAALLAALLALGAHNPLYPALYRWVPGLALFRAPARWLLVSTFAAAMLSGIGLQAVVEASSWRLTAARAALATLVACAAAGTIWLMSPWGAAAFQSPQTPFGPWGQAALLWVAAGLMVPFCLSEGRLPGISRSWLAGFAISLLVVDQFAVSFDLEIQHVLAADGLENNQPDSLPTLRDSSPPDRFWSGSSQIVLEKWQRTDIPASISPEEVRGTNASWAQALMPSCIAARFGAWSLTGVWGALMPLQRHARPIYIPETPWPEKLRWLRLLNVAYYAGLRPLSVPSFEPLRSSSLLFYYRDPQRMPRAFVVPGARRAEGEAALAAVGDPGFDPHREVVLETGTADPEPGTAAFTPARLADYRDQTVTIESDAAGSGYLVLMDTWYPGWRARVDGSPAAMWPANWVGRAVHLPQGAHRVEMRFEPTSVRVGLFVSLFSVSGLLAFLTVSPRRRRTAGPERSPAHPSPAPDGTPGSAPRIHTGPGSSS